MSASTMFMRLCKSLILIAQPIFWQITLLGPALSPDGVYTTSGILVYKPLLLIRVPAKVRSHYRLTRVSLTVIMIPTTN